MMRPKRGWGFSIKANKSQRDCYIKVMRRRTLQYWKCKGCSLPTSSLSKANEVPTLKGERYGFALYGCRDLVAKGSAGIA